MNWTLPTEVQKLCLPTALEGGDLLGFAQTGTGKTGVFLITITQFLLKHKEKDSLQNISQQTQQNNATYFPQCVVIAPTRELVIQIHEEFEKLSQASLFTLSLLSGGWILRNKRLDSKIIMILLSPHQVV